MRLFLPEQIKPYIRCVEDIVSPYNNKFSKPIIYRATEQLLADLKQYNFIRDKRPIHPDDDYYFALFDNRERHLYFYRSWAAVYVIFSIRPHVFELRSSDDEANAHNSLRKFLFDFLEPRVGDDTLCPYCFPSAFLVNIEKRIVENPCY